MASNANLRHAKIAHNQENLHSKEENPVQLADNRRVSRIRSILDGL